MSSARRTSKPPRPFESLASLKAAKKTYCSIDYQIECLNELYNQLMPQNSNRRASSSSRAQDDSQRDPKVLQQLRELKANLRSNYGNPRLFPPLECLKVVLMFDDEKKAFFDIRLRPGLGYPKGYPFLIDDSEGTISGLSEAIYQEVLKAVQEEEKKEEESNNKSLNHNNNSHAAEDGLVLVNIKQEVDVDEEEEEDGLIQLDDDSDEEPSNNELQQEEEIYNSQVNPPPPPPDNNALSADFINSASSAAVAAAVSSSSSANVPPENGPAVSSQATDIDISSSNNTAEQNPRQSSLSSGLTVRVRRPSERQSEEALPIKLEPTESSTTTITRVNRPPPNQAPRTGHEEAPAAAATAESASVAAPPAAAAANVRVIQVNPPPPHHNNNNNNDGTTPLGQQRQQQQPPAAAVTACGTLTMRPTANSSIFHIVRSKRPADHSKAAQPSHSHSQPAQDNPKRAKVSTGSASLVSRSSAAAADKRRAAAAATATATSTARTLQPQQHRPSSTSTHAVTAANVEAYLRAHCPSYFSVKNTQTKVQCPDCPKPLTKYLLKDHLLWVHHGLKPYHCRWPGCSFTTGWRSRAAYHVKDFHRGNYAQYIEYREE